MNTIADIFAIPFGRVLYFAFLVTDSFGLSIVIFSIIAKLLLFPLTRMAHLNSIRLLKLQPALIAIQKRYPTDKERLNEERYELFLSERYNPLIGIVPLLAQLLMLMGMLRVMYDPLLHIRLPEGTNLYFLGVDLGEFHIAMPFLSGVVALVFALVQNYISPGALSQGKKTNIGLIIFTVGLSVYFAAVTPAGVGFYWTVGNLFAILVVFTLYRAYNPYKLAAETLALKKAESKTPDALNEERKKNKENKIRENTDVKRFISAKKQLVFYAISGGQYKFYKTIIDYLLENSNVVVHYLTNDPTDSVFQKVHPQFAAYYAGQRRTISLMLKMDTSILITTVPDLQTFHMKRSIVRDDIEYIYTFHSTTSTHLIYREKAFDYFDTIFCVGPHQVSEIRIREKLANISKKNLIKTGYGLYDQLVESYSGLTQNPCQHMKPKVLIAPSWQADNLLETCIDSMLDSLLGNGYEIIVRPHPQHIKLFPHVITGLCEKYMEYSKTREIVFELDFSGNDSIFMSDILITDWSGIAYEFAYCTLKPCVFINTPMKVMNPDWQKYGIEPLDISLRDRVGISVELDNVDKLNEAFSKLLSSKNTYHSQINEIVQQNLYYPGRNGEAGGKYIIKQLEAKNA